jgi:hypothetical protein
LLDQGGNQEVMTDALQAAYDLIDATAGFPRARNPGNGVEPD